MVQDAFLKLVTFILFVAIFATSGYVTISNASNNGKMFHEIIEEILIPEFINKRPFRDYTKKDEILQVILKNVNSKVGSTMGNDKVQYRSTTELLKSYDYHISRFEKNYLEHYKDMAVEEIQGWDKIMLVAKNLQDDDLKFACDNVVSSDLIDKYTKKKPIIAPENNSNQLGKDNNNEYELSNIKDARNVSDII
jgi:hypothetical protein